MEMAISLTTLVGMLYAAYRGMKWLFRSGQTQVRRQESLTPRDLKVLEEAASRLMADLRATTDECVAKIEAVMEKAEARLDESQPVTVEPGPALTGEVQLLENLRKMKAMSASSS